MNVLHICSNFQVNPLYKELLYRLESEVHNMVIAPIFEPKEDDLPEYNHIPVFYFQREKGILNRLHFSRKIKNITDFVESNIPLNDVQLIHAHTWYSDGAVAYNLYKKYKIPYIVAIRDTDLNLFFTYFIQLRHLGYEILENASEVIFINKIYQNKLADRLPTRIEKNVFAHAMTIYNGINSYWLNNLHTPKPVSLLKIRLIYAGAFSARKNLLTTMKAMEILRNQNFDVTLTAIGKSDTPSNYEEKVISTAAGKPYIQLLPHANATQILEQYRQHDIFVMPSFTETFGLAYAEALSQGLPIIYSKNEGFDQIFPDGIAGYPVNPNSADDIAEKILLISQRYATIEQHIADLQPLTEFNWDDIYRHYLRLYHIITKL